MSRFDGVGRNRHNAIRLFGWAMLVLLVAAMPSFAQSIGTILGTVKDSSGAVVPQAKVTVVNTDTNDSRTATTGDDGSFRFPALATGHYSLRIEKDGFSTQTQTGLTLEVTQEMVVSPVLQVGTSTQEVTVTGEAPLVNTTNSSLGGLVNEEKMADLPLNGRNYVDLALMQTGITVAANAGSSNAQGGTRGVYFSADGATTRSNMFVLDGGILLNSRGGSTSSESGTTLGVDGTKEFKVQTGTFSAEYGNAMGGQVVMVSKNGTNQYHGDVFEYLRNSSLDARNFFDYGYLSGGSRLPHFERNNFGGSFGGPIKKDKTFFYGAYEGLRQALGQTIVDVVPAAGCHGAAGAMIWNGVGTQPVGSTGNCPQIGGATASATTIAAAIAPLLALYPNPNLSGNQYQFLTGSPESVDWGQMRIDQNISGSDTLFGRYSVDKAFLGSGISTLHAVGAGFPQFRIVQGSFDQYVTIGENHIFSPTVLSSARLSFSRTNWNDANFYPNGAASITGPQYSFVTGQAVGSIGISGLATFGPNTNDPVAGIQNLYQLSDDLFYTKGKHALKFGYLGIKWNVAAGIAPRVLGQVSFSGVGTFLAGTPSSYQALLQNPTPVVTRNYMFYTQGFYAQDDWQATPRLTLNLGLRYEFMTQPEETSGNQVGIRNIDTDTSTTPGPVIAPPSKRNFSPRVGFAWDPQGNGKTSVRGGFGLYQDVGNMGALLSGMAYGEPPLTQLATHTGGTFTVPFTFTPGDITKPSFQIMDYNLKTPSLLKYTLSVDRQLPWGMGLSVSYDGSRGDHLYQGREGDPTVPAAIVNGFPYYNGTEARINQNFTTTTVFTTTAGWSSYNALQVALNRRLKSGLEYQIAYTYAHEMDDTQTQFGPGDCAGASGMSQGVDPGNDSFEKGPGCFDLRHNLRFNVLYNIPNIKSDNFAAKMEHGWWVGSIVSIESGFAFTPVLGAQRSKSGTLNSQVDYPNLATSADAAACPAISSTCAFVPVAFNPSTAITGTAAQWFNPDMFVDQPIVTAPGGTIVCTTALCPTSAPGYSTLGNTPRGLLRGPGLRNVDLSINKDTALPFLGEQGKLEFRAEMFNILNHANLGMPNGAVFAGKTSDFSPYIEAPSTSGPAITSTVTTSRQIQLALKVIF